MSVEGLGNGRRVSITEAHQIANTNSDASIVWRPESDLPEEQQYALIYNE